MGVQFAGADRGTNDAAGTTVATVGMVTPQDCAIVVLTRTGTANGQMTVTDTAGNKYTLLARGDDATTGSTGWWLCQDAIAKAANVITLTTASDTFRSILACQYVYAVNTGLDANPAPVIAGSASSTTSASFSTVAAETVIVCGVNLGALETSITAGLIGGVAANQRLTNSTLYCSMSDLIVTSVQSGITAAYSWSATATTSHFFTLALAARYASSKTVGGVRRLYPREYPRWSGDDL